MKEIIKHTLRKVTLELVYQAVDERATEIISEIKEIKKRQEDDFRYLIQKMDTDIGQLRTEVKNEVGQLRSEIGQLRGDLNSETGQLRTEMNQLKNEVKNETAQLRTEIGQLKSEIKSETGQLRAEMGQLRSEMSAINQRIDTIIQMLMTIRQDMK
ncbi:MAG: hypothetical protein QY305_07280 [Candidatus Brocadiaceae baterium WH-1]|nr:MAG: hypothetical protein QY305_07280 [Candidatus Jettenia sp. AMX2]